jgi:hypothetical protein
MLCATHGFRACIAIPTTTQAACDGHRVYLDDLGSYGVIPPTLMTDALVATVIARRDASMQRFPSTLIARN